MRSINILLVEDNEGDILLTTEAFEESKIINLFRVIRDGKAAINFFENLNDRDDIPDLVLLDINLPKMNGQEVLKYLKDNEKYKHIPVIILTTSSSETDILQSYKNHVNCYITKPVDVNSFINAVTRIEDFWISIVSIPNNSPYAF